MGVDRMTADIYGDGGQIKAEWYLTGGGTIKSTIQTQAIRGYVLPKREQADIVASGYRIHADMSYGNYRFQHLN